MEWFREVKSNNSLNGHQLPLQRAIPGIFHTASLLLPRLKTWWSEKCVIISLWDWTERLSVTKSQQETEGRWWYKQQRNTAFPPNSSLHMGWLTSQRGCLLVQARTAHCLGIRNSWMCYILVFAILLMSCILYVARRFQRMASGSAAEMHSQVLWRRQTGSM